GEQDRQPPQRGDVHRFVDDTFAERAVAEPGAGDGAARPRLFRERDADRIADGAAEHSVGVEIAQLEVLTATSPAADAVRPAEDPGEQRIDFTAIGEEVPVAAVIAEYAVARTVERGRDGNGRDLLADAGVGGTGNTSERELLEQHLLEVADAAGQA